MIRKYLKKLAATRALLREKYRANKNTSSRRGHDHAHDYDTQNLFDESSQLDTFRGDDGSFTVIYKKTKSFPSKKHRRRRHNAPLDFNQNVRLNITAYPPYRSDTFEEPNKSRALESLRDPLFTKKLTRPRSQKSRKALRTQPPNISLIHRRPSLENSPGHFLSKGNNIPERTLSRTKLRPEFFTGPFLAQVSPFDIPEPRFSNSHILRELQNRALENKTKTNNLKEISFAQNTRALNDQRKNRLPDRPFSHPIPVLYSSKNTPSYFAPQTPESTTASTASTASTDTQDTPDIVQLVHERLNTLADRVNKEPATKSNRINNTPADAPNRKRFFLATGQPRTPPDQLHAENVNMLNEIIKESAASEPAPSTNRMMPAAQNYVSIENIKIAPAAPNVSTEKDRRTSTDTPQNVEGPVQQVTQFLKTLFSG
jgi:hypothetical protein